MSEGFDPGSPFAFLDPQETDFWYFYMKMLLRLRYEMNRQLRASSELSISDYDVLVALTSEPDGMVQISDLAVRIGWERSRISHQVSRLRDRALVDTSASSKDQRATDVRLTDHGRRVLAEATPGHIDLVRKTFLDQLSRREMVEMHQAFDRIYDALIERGSLPRPRDHP